MANQVEVDDALRGARPMTPEIQAQVDAIDHALLVKPTPEPLLLWTPFLYEVPAMTGDAAARTVHERTYMYGYFTYNACVREHPGTVAQLRVPAGVPALWLPALQGDEAPQALLLARGLLLRVDGVDERDDRQVVDVLVSGFEL